MTHKTALIIDPEWRLQPPPVNLGQYQAHVKTELGKLPPTDFLMTACSRDDLYFVANMFHDGSSITYNNPNYPAQQLYSPHFPELKKAGQNFTHYIGAKYWLNHKIMSAKLTEMDKKTKQHQPLLGLVPVNTINGLMNANAGNDAIVRMLTNTKHKIDQIVIIDPYSRITANNQYTQAGIMHETITAWNYAQLHPSIPCAVII